MTDYPLRSKSQDTVSRILAAAMDVFAEGGFEGARVDEIAKCAGVNKATIYYHIGDKRALYAAAMHNVTGSTREKISKEASKYQAPDDKIRAMIRTFAGALDANPSMGAMMMREMASGGTELPEVVIKDIAAIISLVKDILADGWRKETFSIVNPFLIYLMVIGPCVLYKTSTPVRKKMADIYGIGTKSDGLVAGEIVEEIERLVLKAIAT